ncbi:MAG: translocation/assembly module TamB domain-containing protein, partial [Verrucomicrobiales bacterium]
YGRISSPKTIITSDPPLPESEAISLLATGLKSSDLENSGALAGDAALLLIDKIRRKFSKDSPLERRPGDLRDTLSFKAGGIDPRTGKRSASASLELSDNVSISAALDVEGNYRGWVTYIIRFK